MTKNRMIAAVVVAVLSVGTYFFGADAVKMVQDVVGTAAVSTQ